MAGIEEANLPPTEEIKTGYLLKLPDIIFHIDYSNSCGDAHDRHVIAGIVGPQVNGTLFGVFDGYGYGERTWYCAEMISTRLLEYIAASLFPYQNMAEMNMSNTGTRPPNYSLTYYSPTVKCKMNSIVHDLICNTSFLNFQSELTMISNNYVSTEERFKRAFQALDDDLCKEREVSRPYSFCFETMNVALSGASVCVVYVNCNEIVVANTGECRAVMGNFKSEDCTWTHYDINSLHDINNEKEHDRILKAHSGELDLITNGKLLEWTSLTRAFGDHSLKSPICAKELLGVDNRVPLGVDNRVPVLKREMISPPYLIVEPEVLYLTLHPENKYIILGTSGFWSYCDQIDDEELLACFWHTEACDDQNVPKMNAGTYLLGKALQNLSNEGLLEMVDMTVHVIFFTENIKLMKA